MPVELNIVESVTELDTTVVTVNLVSASEPGPAGAGVPTGGTSGQVLTKDSATDYDTSWQDATGGAGGAPADVDYLVGTTNGTLSAEIVVGTSPGGELGGTWASPTVDATHSGSSHASVQAAAEATAAAALLAHTTDTADAHAASAITFTPDGSIAATTVQAAIVEVRDEAAGGGAPSTADYLVGTANGGLSAEIVVGTSPGGELGGTWASPTVDATHSGSSHAGVQAAAEATAAAALSAHESDTTSVHGITDTSTLYRSGGTDVALADGGTGASLADPGADRIMFWDDSAGAVTWLAAGTNLTITDTTIAASGSGGAAADDESLILHMAVFA